MHRLLRNVSFALACLLVMAGFGSRAEAGDCRPAAIERLRAQAPEGFAIYQKIADKKFFTGWLSCSEDQRGVSTAVHETVHHITGDTDAYPLIRGGQLKRPHEAEAFFAPSMIAGKFKPSDFVTTYLRPGSASSSSDFLYLLDELNAYPHDLNTAVKLSRAANFVTDGDEVDHRDGLAALMAFVAVYVERAEQSEPATWNGLREPRVARTVSELWGQAEQVMASSCGIPNFGGEDRPMIRQFCQAGPQGALAKILGRPAVCPTACLKPMPVASHEDTELVDEMPTGSLGYPAAKSVGRR